MTITNNINPHIFREYDIRGIQDKDLNPDIAYTIGRSFGTILKNLNQTRTVVGYDNRPTSPAYATSYIQGILDCGINVYNLGLVTTPMYYFSWSYLGVSSGTMITASHNPKEYNGFKVSFNGIHNACGKEVTQLYTVIQNGKFSDDQGSVEQKNIKNAYLDFLTESIHLGNRKPKIVVDCGNGTPSIIIRDVFKKLGIEFIPLFCDSDPTFPNHTPDPSVNEYMVQLQAKVKAEQADLGIGLDGDGDRVGFVDEQGNLIHSDYFLIIAARNILPKLEDKRVLYDIKCTKSLEDEIKKLGGIPIQNRTGNSYLRKRVAEDNIPLGGEYSGHVCFNDKFPGYDDGIYAGLRMIEILSHTDKTMSQLLDGITHYESTPELIIHTEEDKKQQVVEKVKKYCEQKQYSIITLDGVKAIFDDGFALVRASNTGPNISARFEATTKQRVEELQTEFLTLIQ